MSDRSGQHGGGRLITVREGAEILSVTQATVIEWIQSGRVRSVSMPDGSYRLRVNSEQHYRSGPLTSGFYALDLGLSEQSEEQEEWRRELLHKQRERGSAGLSPGPINVQAFARALGERFQAVVPPSMHVSVQDGMVWLISAGGGRAGLAGLAGSRNGDDPFEVMRRAAEDALTTAQDCVSEDTTEPWPAVAGQLPGGFPSPHAQIADGQLRMFYGDPEAPVLELTAIRLSDVLELHGER